MARIAFEVESVGFNPRIIDAGSIPQAIRKFKTVLTREYGKPKGRDARRNIKTVRVLGPIH